MFPTPGHDCTHFRIGPCVVQTVLAGSYDDCVYAYSVDYGRALGKVNLVTVPHTLL